VFYLQNMPRPTKSPLAIATGARLRALREARGLSVSRLAVLSGLGKGTLSELETGLRNPTLQTLFAVTTALDLPVSAALPPPGAVDEPPAAIRGDAIEALLVDRFTDVTATIELYRATLAAGREQHSEPHAAGVTERWIVYAGTVELGPLDAPVRLGPGDSTAFAADVPHRYSVADEDVAATLLVRYPR
jgi:XRE family transcriptional regulator, regulator of sulfur utilization